jgi:hypothetical protein
MEIPDGPLPGGADLPQDAFPLSPEDDCPRCRRTQALIASFGDQDTLIRAIQLSIKIVEPASADKLETVLCGFSNNFPELKARMRAKTGLRALRRRLQAMAARARQDAAELEDFKIISRLVDAARDNRGSCSAKDVITWHRVSADLRSLAKIAAEKIPTGKGHKRADGDVSPEELCADMVRQAWRVGRGEEPGSQSIDVLAACESLWRAGGGKASKDADARKWRRHLEAASLRRRQGTNGAAFFRNSDGSIVLVEAKLPEGSTQEA